MLMIPEAWEKHTLMDENRRAFYEYHAAMMEPWDGPAAVAFTDGRQIGATLDRNGLRPARYPGDRRRPRGHGLRVRRAPIPDKKIVKKWRLQPGKMFLIDMEQGRIIDDKGTQRIRWPTRSPSRVDREDPHQARRSAVRRRAVCRRPGVAAWIASRLSVHPGRRQGHSRADGPER